MLKDRDHINRGYVHPGRVKETWNADVIPGASIRIYGTDTDYREPKAFDLQFRVGDVAIYDRYNFIYTGPIVSITAKTVTIDARGTGEGKKRLSLFDFCRENLDFDAARIAKHNTEESYCV